MGLQVPVRVMPAGQVSSKEANSGLVVHCTRVDASHAPDVQAYSSMARALVSGRGCDACVMLQGKGAPPVCLLARQHLHVRDGGLNASRCCTCCCGALAGGHSSNGRGALSTWGLCDDTAVGSSRGARSSDNSESR